MAFLILIIVAMFDPFIFLGSMVIGVFARQFWTVVLCGAIWGLLVVIVNAEFALSVQQRLPPVFYVTQTLAAVLDSLIAWSIVIAFRKRKVRERNIKQQDVVSDFPDQQETELHTKLVGSIIETLNLCSGLELDGKYHRFSSKLGINVLVLISKDYGDNKYLFDIHESQIKFVSEFKESLVAFGFVGKKNFLTIPAKSLIDQLGKLNQRVYPKTGEKCWRLELKPAYKHAIMESYVPDLAPFEMFPVMRLDAMQSLQHLTGTNHK